MLVRHSSVPTLILFLTIYTFGIFCQLFELNGPRSSAFKQLFRVFELSVIDTSTPPCFLYPYQSLLRIEEFEKVSGGRLIEIFYLSNLNQELCSQFVTI